MKTHLIDRSTYRCGKRFSPKIKGTYDPEKVTCTVCAGTHMQGAVDPRSKGAKFARNINNFIDRTIITKKQNAKT